MTGPGPIFTRVSACPAVFGVSRTTVYRWAEKGYIDIIKRGKLSFVRTSQMIAYIDPEGDYSGD